MINIKKIAVGELGVHPRAATVICQTKKSETHRFTMENFGQVVPISVVIRDGKPFIIDGIERWKVAKQLPTLFSTLDCRLFELTDEEIVNQRILLNSTRKLSVREKCLMIESVLGLLGKQQGIKRKALELDNLQKELDNPTNSKKDRFHWACDIAKTGCSASTLRKLMFIYNAEDIEKEEILNLIDEGKLRIDKGYKLLDEKYKKIKESEILKKNHIGYGELGTYKLFCKSSIAMDEIPDETIRLCINSHPYFNLRIYRNQGVAPHGQESSVEEYIENYMRHCREVRKKLKSNGVLVTIIGETYKNGYKGICTKVETALEKEGWKILDVNIWGKKNPKPTPHPSRFLNGYERIIVACKSEEKPVFNEIKKQSSTGSFKVIKSASLKNGDNNYSMASPESDITNLFSTSVFNKKEHTKVDKDFKHDAPAPEEIYQRFIMAYSIPGDTVIDNFVGSGTVSEGLKIGRNVIGYDIDPASIEFSRKRFEDVLNSNKPNLLIAA